MKTQTRRIRDAISNNLNAWCDDYEFSRDDRENIFNDVVRDILPLMPQKKEIPTDEATETKIKLIDDMITHAEKVIGAPGSINYGSRKWEQAIKYLIKVKAEKGWDIQVLWAYLENDEVKFEKSKLSYGMLMADPELMLKIWMPRAHATKTETTPATDLISLMEKHDVR